MGNQVDNLTLAGLGAEKNIEVSPGRGNLVYAKYKPWTCILH